MTLHPSDVCRNIWSGGRQKATSAEHADTYGRVSPHPDRNGVSTGVSGLLPALRRVESVQGCHWCPPRGMPVRDRGARVLAYPHARVHVGCRTRGEPVEMRPRPAEGSGPIHRSSRAIVPGRFFLDPKTTALNFRDFCSWMSDSRRVLQVCHDAVCESSRALSATKPLV